VAASNSAPAFEPDEVLAFTREFDAPLALVWRMWRDPEHMVRWHGPEGYWLTDCHIDFRVGGKWSRTMSRAADHAHRIYGEYLEIREPERLRFTYINDYDGHEMVVTLDFQDAGGKTLMHFHQAPFTSVEERDSHGWGWMSGLDLLASYLVKVEAAGGMPVGAPRSEGLADDIVALRKLGEETRHADAAKDR
jgi:uncharacterized protein YndB with AHSA1/START domain